ncbi:MULTISPECIES: PGN_0703 family putative restriction endonuclease [Mycobacteriaceae]|uniref:PGN_0703 family putative restriction endonuclease n=1 Tax=Mycobacteriaceae TaxID=1762 RepID=UPI0011D60DFE|nr:MULTISPECIES: hypothetical protein [Mycobacteriaceae]TXI56030.1 MAG: hypothetical protein E6Q55_30065 [Mycolicibacterium mageritense]
MEPRDSLPDTPTADPESLSDLLAAIGPQRTADSLLARRVRFHQSWYRAAVLGRTSFGQTAGAAPRPLGSVLADADAQAGLNFTSLAARRLFERRHAEGWGVDPVRCAKYLTSSQALTINLFGLLVESMAWSARVLRDALHRPDISAVKWIQVEYAPRRRSQYLHDMTRLDALMLVSTRTGDELLAVELKYVDRFNSRLVNIDRIPYRRLATTHDLWRDVDHVLQASEVNQLVRCHALAVAVSDDLITGQKRPARLVVVHHHADPSSTAAVDRYRAHLQEPALVQAVTLKSFVTALHVQARSPKQRRAARDLYRRYVDESESEPAWDLHQSRRLGAKVGR